MVNDYERIHDALAGVNWQDVVGGTVRLTRGWPKSLERLPCIAVMESGNTHSKHADDMPVMDRVDIDIRVFGIESAVVDTVALAADKVMERALGYRRTLCYEDGGASTADVRMKLMRYRMFFPIDWDD